MLFKFNRFTQQRAPWLAIFTLYAVEFLDEFIYGLSGAVLPSLKTSLALSYTEVGLLLSVPSLIGIFAEPLLGLLADTRHRRGLVLGGILATFIGLVLVAVGQLYLVILFAYTIMYIGSGSYVNISQATLVDRNPDRAEPTMARWVLIGEIAVAISPILVTVAFYFGFGWRGLYWATAGLAGLFIALLWPLRYSAESEDEEEDLSPRSLWANFWQGLRNRELLRWVLLAEVADLMLDRHLEVTGLYFHDVAGVSLAGASAVVAWMSIAGLVGSFALVPLIEKVNGLKLLRVTALMVLAAYAAYLLIPNVWVKIGLVGAISFLTASWFPTLRARSYQAFAGKSGVVMAVSSVLNISTLIVPFVLGWLADALGLQWAMWLLALGPVALLVWVPRNSPNPEPVPAE
jgi:MFS transporter, FSR family, fosmidomycin resistance protein